MRITSRSQSLRFKGRQRRQGVLGGETWIRGGTEGETRGTTRETNGASWDREGDGWDRLRSDLCLPCPTYQSPLDQAVSLGVPAVPPVSCKGEGSACILKPAFTPS